MRVPGPNTARPKPPSHLTYPYTPKLGFHEDGFTSGLKAASSIPLPQLRVSLPFPIASPDRASGSATIRKFSEGAFSVAESARYWLSAVLWWALGVVGLVDGAVNKTKAE